MSAGENEINAEETCCPFWSHCQIYLGRSSARRRLARPRLRRMLVDGLDRGLIRRGSFSTCLRLGRRQLFQRRNSRGGRDAEASWAFCNPRTRGCAPCYFGWLANLFFVVAQEALAVAFRKPLWIGQPVKHRRPTWLFRFASLRRGCRGHRLCGAPRVGLWWWRLCTEWRGGKDQNIVHDVDVAAWVET